MGYKKKGNKLFANGLKLGINRIYGGFSDDHGWLKDVKALLQTTINGQLMLLMLIESLHLEGIETYYANTDGITVICPKDKKEVLNKIWKEWDAKLNMALEEVEFKKSYIRDVNNFINVKLDGEVKLKGAYEYTGYLEKYGEFDLTGSFSNPVVPYAVVLYFTEGIPVEDTLRGHIKKYPKDGIYDFCTAKKSSKQFDNILFTMNKSKVKVEKLQQSVRYYVSNSTQRLYKVKDKTERELLSLVKNSKHMTNSYIFSHDNLPQYKRIGYVESYGYVYLVEQKVIINNPKKEWLHYDEVEAGWNITLFNNYFQSDDYNIDYNYYIYEANKLIDAIEKSGVSKNINDTQLKLF